LTRLFLPDMLKRKNGKILNVASTAAFQPGPLMAVYYASKAYVLWFSEALANELHGSGVSVTALAPGPTRTEFQKRANMEESGLLSGKMLSVMDSKTVARIGYRGLMKNKTLVIPGFINKVVAFSTRLGPRKMNTQIARKIQEKRKQ
jgi:short-subunit dehydrogenase